MAEQSSDAEHGRRPTSETAFRDLTKKIAERNEQAQNEAREHRAKREREQGIGARHRLNINE